VKDGDYFEDLFLPLNLLCRLTPVLPEFRARELRLRLSFQRFFGLPRLRTPCGRLSLAIFARRLSILKINKVNLFVSSVMFVFWYHSPNVLRHTAYEASAIGNNTNSYHISAYGKKKI
jgi:hypothetical protein